MGTQGRTVQHAHTPAVRVLVLGLLMATALVLSACIQPHTVFTPFSVITLIVDVPENMTRAGIRMALSGTGKTAGDNDSSYTDTTGFASIDTQATGHHFVVARHQDYDIAVGGTAANLTPGGAMQVFEQGRMIIPSVGVSLSPDYFYPYTGEDLPPQEAPRRLGMRKKRAGKARFVFLAEDSDILKQTLHPDHKPQALGTVSVTGDWNNFNFTQEDIDPVNGARFLYDDGSLINPEGGDDIGGDGAYTRILDLEPGEHTYAFLINGVTLYTRDPYEESSRQVRVVARVPAGFPGNPGAEEVREFRASSVLVVKPF